MFHEFHQPKTSHRPRCTLYRNWIQDPIHKHYGNIRLVPQQNCVLLLNNTDYCHLHRHICKNRDQHNVDKQFWSYETEKNKEYNGIISISSLHWFNCNWNVSKKKKNDQSESKSNNLSICMCFVLSWKKLWLLNKLWAKKKRCWHLPRQNLYVLHREQWPQHALLQSIFVFHHHQNSYTIWPIEFCPHDFVSK